MGFSRIGIFTGKGFKVKQRVMPSDTGQYFDKLRTEFQAGGGDIDIIIGDVIWPAQFAVNGWVSDLSDRFTDTDAFLPGPMTAATYDGKVWAVPWYTDAGLLYYRQDLLDKAGFSEPPETWDDLMEMAAKVQGFTPQQIAYVAGDVARGDGQMSIAVRLDPGLAADGVGILEPTLGRKPAAERLLLYGDLLRAAGREVEAHEAYDRAAGQRS